MTSQQVIEWAPVIGAGAAVATALTAFVAAVIALVQLRASRIESKQRSRPMVGVDLRPARLANTNFVLTNYGPSPAYNVKVTFDPPFDTMSDADLREFGGYITRRYAKRVPTMMSGAELTNIIGSLSLGDQPEVGSNPFTVTVTYGDKHDEEDTYTDKYVLDTAVVALETKAVSNRDPDVSLAKLAQAMHKLATDNEMERLGFRRHSAAPKAPAQPPKFLARVRTLFSPH